jgi:15-cis-phytoene desaturase
VSNNLGEEYSMKDVIIVGGGLAGLSAAARLAKEGKSVTLLERGQIGGRAVTLKLKDFSFNFGAHAIYGRDTSILQNLEKELDIKINWKDFNPNKAKYDIGNELTDVPANIKGLFRTKILKSMDKLQFTFNIFKTMISVEKGKEHVSIKKWMDDRHISEDVKKMMLTLASSNFFTSEPEKIPSTVYFNYYRKLFKTNKPVAYVGGGWQSLINQFVNVIEENGGEIVTKQKVDQVEVEDDRVISVTSKGQTYFAKEFIFAIPPKELKKIFAETSASHYMEHYAQYDPSYVFVYDIALKERIEVPYTYIYNQEEKMFITDISYYDETCVPEGGQLLQAIAYMKPGDIGNKMTSEAIQSKIEKMYDKHFKGWRELLVVPRISKRAMAQEISWNMKQLPMPVVMPNLRNTYFSGDWCEGEGQLSELSFTSAYKATSLILEK